MQEDNVKEDEINYDFSSLEVAEQTSNAIKEMNFSKMTAVQVRMIQYALNI